MSWPTTHGMARSAEYTVWENMVQRCTNPKAPNYERYGGAGVELQFENFTHFFNHIGRRPTGTTVDRIDPAGHYAPGNVRWATASKQELNKLLPQTWPGVSFAPRDGTYSWRYTRGENVRRGFGYATQRGAFFAKVQHMHQNNIQPSRSDLACASAAAEAGPSMFDKEKVEL